MFSRVWCVALLMVCGAVMARDLPRSDPARQEILDAARPERGEQFVVRDLFRAGRFASLCGDMVYANGKPVMIEDHGGEVQASYKGILLFNGERWLPYRVVKESADGSAEAYASTTWEAGCGYALNNNQLPTSEALLRKVLVLGVRRDIRDYIAGIFPVEEIRRYGDFGVPGVFAQDVPIEHGKEDWVRGYAQGGQTRCRKDAACLARLRAGEAELRKARSDVGVSSLVWDYCAKVRYGGGDYPEQISECIARMRTQPVCRAGMQFFHDNADIAGCVGLIDEECRRHYADPKKQDEVCGDRR